jgi:cobalt-precorrin-5B (C1)-methyltransferase
MSSSVPPRDRSGLRTGFTTGACAAAAARAATRYLLRAVRPETIEITLPNGSHAIFPLHRAEMSGSHAVCSVIKDAGDDPDCTHGAELIADVELRRETGIDVLGGNGVARVTKPGLGLEVGSAAINPVPLQNITAMVREELSGGQHSGAVVVISVPRGEEMALKTINARLGLIGGISILGTTGIVKPYSTAAYKMSVIQAIDIAVTQGCTDLVLTTGGRSEAYAMKLFPDLPETAFIQVGDFVGVAVKHCARKAAKRAILVGMMGKLSKMADGKMQTHAAGSEVNMELLAGLAAELGASDSVLADMRQATTARRVLEIALSAGVADITMLVCRRAAENCCRHAGGSLPVEAYLMDFEGGVLGHWEPTPRESNSQ